MLSDLLDIAHLYGRYICYRISVVLPAEFYGIGTGEGQSVSGCAAKIDIADPADIFASDVD